MKIAVVFSTLTGNTEKLSRKIVAYLQETGRDVKLLDAMMTKPEALKDYDLVILGSSTHGEGELNPISEMFLSQFDATVSYDKIPFAYFSLGDSSYENFCQSGKLCKELIESRGGTSVGEIFEVDGEPDDTVAESIFKWAEGIITEVS